MSNFSKYIAALAEMSNNYGSNPEYVLAGGGNTSFKSADRLWVKGSGTSLASIKPEDFVVLERKKLDQMWSAVYPEEEASREAAVLADMMDARVQGENRRPSVETLLHNLFPHQYVLHVHPAIVNGLTCSKAGENAMKQLFPDAVWVEVCKPGYILALECRKKMEAYKEETGKNCNLLFLQNHGIFFAGDTTQEIENLATYVMGTMAFAVLHRKTDYDAERVAELAAELAVLCGEEKQPAVVKFAVNPDVLAYDPTTKSLSPDHIVYAKAQQMILPVGADVKAVFAAFTEQNGYKPRIVFAEGLGMFSCGKTAQEATTAQSVMMDAIKVAAYAQSFGGVAAMPDFLIDFIVNWEVESYRSKISLSSENKG